MSFLSQKQSLTDSEIVRLLSVLGSSSYIDSGNALIFDTVCHNLEEGSKKLYYYKESKLFKCYTECCESFDIFSLVIKNHQQKGLSFSFSEASRWISKTLGIFFIDPEPPKEEVFFREESLEKKELSIYEDKIIDRLPFYIIYDWHKEGIDKLSLERYNIRVNPVSSTVIIPHYNINGELVGIRQRILAEEDSHLGKYRPAYINGISYPHALSYNLYGIHLNKENIKKEKKAIVFEGEKSVIYLDKYENSIALSCCGSNISSYQIDLLKELGVKEIVVAFDKEFLEEGDSLFIRQMETFSKMYNKYKGDIYFSFIVDLYNKLDYKDSPVDKGEEVFDFLYKNRIYLGEML